MHAEVLSYIRRHALMRAGDRVGLAVSGGADSVALLRLMLDLRAELGVVLSVVHFNHKIRGPQADADEHFVAQLAAVHGLDFRCSAADTPAYARAHRVSLETAGRELRCGYFGALLASGAITSVATAHTMDDQAETVLLRAFRGAGTRGLAGIFPTLPLAAGHVVRPLLATRRAELRVYLNSIRQPWREDASNLDVKHTRNRLRHELLPIIEREFNPSIVQVLTEMAEVARGEEEFWEAEVRRVLEKHIPHSARNDQRQGEGKAIGAAARSPELPEDALDRDVLLRQPTAMQRRLVRALAEKAGLRLEFAHIEEILEVVANLQHLESKEVKLPKGWIMVASGRELKFELRRHSQQEGGQYEYSLPVPGEVLIPELAATLRATVLPAERASSGYNRMHLLDPRRLAPELRVRNWRPGDRFQPAHSKSPRKLKELLLRRRIPQPQRACWPVVVSGEAIVWVPELGAAADFTADDQTDTVVVIEGVTAPPPGMMDNPDGRRHSPGKDSAVHAPREVPEGARVMIGAEQIQRRTHEMARQLSADYRAAPPRSG